MKKLITLLLFITFLFSCKKEEIIIRNQTLTDAYIEANRGKTFVEIPAVYEISNIIMALEDQAMVSTTFVDRGIDYYQEVIEYFSPFKDHPLIKTLNLSTNDGLSKNYFNDHYGFRTNSYAYELDGETIVDKQIYGTLRRNDKFTKNLELIQDFALESKMLDFLEAHSGFYQKEIEHYKEVVPLQRERDWLESKFPQHVDTYKVIFSPLTDASHNTKTIKAQNDKDYTEILMFICGFNVDPTELTPLQKASEERVVFTEIDHNYVNPVSDEYVEAINDAMKDLPQWYQGNNYEGAYKVFNEYMTWAVFTLYLKDYYAPDDYLAAKEKMERQMNRSRKFFQFSQFNDKLLELYEANNNNVVDIYPAIIAWVKEIDRS